MFRLNKLIYICSIAIEDIFYRDDIKKLFLENSILVIFSDSYSATLGTYLEYNKMQSGEL